MQTLLVILEQHFYTDGKQYWTDVQCDSRFWERYLNIFEKVIVCARMSDIAQLENKAGLRLSSRENVSFIALPEFRGPKGMLKHSGKIRKTVYEAAKKADKIIFRAPSPILLVAYKSIVKSGKPFAIELAANPETMYSKASVNHPLQPVIQHVNVRKVKKMCMEANGVSYVTSRVLQQLYPCRHIVEPDNKSYFSGSYSTVSLTDEDYFFEEKSYSSANKFANKDFNFLHVGSMTGMRKGQPVFLETVAKLREKGYKIKASLCGDGKNRGDFEQQAQDLGLKNCVTFTGMLNAEEIRNKYRQSDILLLPTNGEGLPRAVIEAMSNGVLCFSSRVDGTVELLEDDCIASSNTADEYVKLIEKFLQNAQSFEDMRKKQFEISKKYESSILTASRNEFYSKLRNCVS